MHSLARQNKAQLFATLLRDRILFIA